MCLVEPRTVSASLSGHLERPRHLESANSAETERQILSQQSTARPSSPLVPLLPSPLHSRTLVAAHTSQQHPSHRQASPRPVRIDSEELPRPPPRLRPLSQSPLPLPSSSAASHAPTSSCNALSGTFFTAVNLSDAVLAPLPSLDPLSSRSSSRSPFPPQHRLRSPPRHISPTVLYTMPAPVYIGRRENGFAE